MQEDVKEKFTTLLETNLKTLHLNHYFRLYFSLFKIFSDIEHVNKVKLFVALKNTFMMFNEFMPRNDFNRRYDGDSPMRVWKKPPYVLGLLKQIHSNPTSEQFLTVGTFVKSMHDTYKVIKQDEEDGKYLSIKLLMNLQILLDPDTQNQRYFAEFNEMQKTWTRIYFIYERLFPDYSPPEDKLTANQVLLITGDPFGGQLSKPKLSKVQKKTLEKEARILESLRKLRSDKLIYKSMRNRGIWT